MSDNISKMDVKQLRNQVQLLSDQFAIMKRKYEDIIYNLDDDNFSSRFVKEKGEMRTAIEINAEGIKTKVSKEDLDNSLSQYSTISQTAEQISTAVVSINNTTDEKLKNYSTVSQTAEQIKSTVTKEYVADKLDGEIVTNAILSSQIAQKADEIYFSVSQEFETKDNANSNYNDLSDSISSVSVKANSISTKVSNLETFKTSVFTQTEYGFTLDGEQTTFTGVIYLTDNNDDKRFSFFHDISQGYEQVVLHSMVYPSIPLVLGDIDGDVYIGHYAEGSQAATRNWVLANAGSGGGSAVAVFG